MKIVKDQPSEVGVTGVCTGEQPGKEGHGQLWEMLPEAMRAGVHVGRLTGRPSTDRNKVSFAQGVSVLSESSPRFCFSSCFPSSLVN